MRTTLMNLPENGGLKMINLETMCQTLKILWVKRYLDQFNKGKWKLFFQQELGKLGGEMIFKCNFKSTEPFIFDKIKIIFWEEVLASWSKLNFHHPADTNTVLNQYLWFNTFIRIENKPIYYKLWVTNKIMTIADLCDKDGYFMSFDGFQAKYNISPSSYLKFYGILAAIPKEWKFL